MTTLPQTMTAIGFEAPGGPEVLETVEREKARLEEVERKRAEGRERVRAAEAEHRGIAMETKRLARELDKLRGKGR